MKTYCFCWYNIASGKREVSFVLAENEKEAEKIRQQYKQVNDDEIEALKIQMQLRDKIKLRTGDK